MLPIKLQKKIAQRTAVNALRVLGSSLDLIDFASNDYLGFSTSEDIYHRASEILEQHNLVVNGATGSRLLTGNHPLYEVAEKQIARFHNAETALIFNSGYDANLGFFGSVPQRGDIIWYDELCHASIRDGITMSNAKAYKFKHNDTNDLEKQLSALRPARKILSHGQSQASNETHYVITESVFSMDGDQPDLKAFAALCKKYGCHLIVDEAHSLGVIGKNGQGLVQELELENEVFARLVTFGKALGSHGAAILGSQALKTYLINFARSFMYTTALPPHTVATVISGYEALEKDPIYHNRLKNNIAILKNEIKKHGLQNHFIASESAIHSCIISGNDTTKHISEVLKKQNLMVKPILSPTVAEGQERLRICLHCFNTEEEIKKLSFTIAQEIN